MTGPVPPESTLALVRVKEREVTPVTTLPLDGREVTLSLFLLVYYYREVNLTIMVRLL